MLLATMQGKETGRTMLVVGLEEGNMRHLYNDRPLVRRLDEITGEGLKGWDITILGPEDTARFVAHYDLREET